MTIQATVDPPLMGLLGGWVVHIWDDEGHEATYTDIEADDERGAWSKALERFEGELDNGAAS